MERRKLKERIVPTLIFGLIVLGWEVFCRSGIVNAILLPSPSQIVNTLITAFIAPKELGYPIIAHAGHTMIHLISGFCLGGLLGILGGISIGLSPTLYRILNPILGVMLPIPAISWAPIAMMWIGTGTPAILAIVSFACFAEVVYNTAMGIRGVPRLYVWQIKSFGATSFFTFFRVMLPAAFPSILAGIRLGLAASWRSLIGSEMFVGVSWGLGFLLFEAEQFYATDVMFSALIIVIILSVLLEQVGFEILERRTLIRWGMARVLEA